MTISAFDSAYPPNAAQIAAAKAAGYSGWNGYFAGQHILNGWSDADFQRVRAGGLHTLAFCSGWADPTAMKIRGERLGIPIVLDCEGGIRGDGAWVQPWLNASGAGLYANYWVFPGKRASRYMLAAYPTSGDPAHVSWSTVYGPRPGAICGWQWAGSHNFAGITVDSEWLDDAYYGVFGPSPGHIEEDDMLLTGPLHARPATLKAFVAGSTYRDPLNDARVAAGTVASGSSVDVDGYLYSSSPVTSPDLSTAAGNQPGPDPIWWHRKDGLGYVPDAILDTSGFSPPPPTTIPAGEPLRVYGAGGSTAPAPSPDLSNYATKADLQGVAAKIPTKGIVTLST